MRETVSIKASASHHFTTVPGQGRLAGHNPSGCMFNYNVEYRELGAKNRVFFSTLATVSFSIMVVIVYITSNQITEQQSDIEYDSVLPKFYIEKACFDAEGITGLAG